MSSESGAGVTISVWDIGFAGCWGVGSGDRQPVPAPLSGNPARAEIGSKMSQGVYGYIQYCRVLITHILRLSTVSRHTLVTLPTRYWCGREAVGKSWVESPNTTGSGRTDGRTSDQVVGSARRGCVRMTSRVRMLQAVVRGCVLEGYADAAARGISHVLFGLVAEGIA